MSDLISRQAAIEAVTKYCIKYDLRELLSDIECLPTAEKRGEWIPVVDGNYIIWECSECHVESEAWTDFCPICGSRNIEETDEAAYEEALEEFRKNPKTYTLDEVEAELGLNEDPNDKAAFEAGYTKAQMELKDAYKPKKGKWIPVTERLPKEDVEVLACSEDGDMEVVSCSYSTEIEGAVIWLTSGWRFGKVTAWMPLPEPFKGVDE